MDGEVGKCATGVISGVGDVELEEPVHKGSPLAVLSVSVSWEVHGKKGGEWV